MYNIICFPHYTAGGLLCDILSNTYSDLSDRGGIDSINHAIGKIGDADTVFDNYDPADLLLDLATKKINKDCWIGTHCWPGLLDPAQFGQIISITTTTYRSKLYRWIRAYHHYYLKSTPWQAVAGMERVDKERETAKNYLKPFRPVTGATNIEFGEIVDNTPSFRNLIAGHDCSSSLDQWQNLNNFELN